MTQNEGRQGEILPCQLWAFTKRECYS